MPGIPILDIVTFGLGQLGGASERMESYEAEKYTSQRQYETELEEWKRNKEIYGLMGEELPEIDTAMDVTRKFYGQKEQLYKTQQRNKFGEFGLETGRTALDIFNKYSGMQSAQGFQGGATQANLQRTRSEFESTSSYGRQNIMDIFNEKMLENVIQRESAISELTGKKREIEIGMAGLDITAPKKPYEPEKPGWLTQSLAGIGNFLGF
jgi:hypothetical protein